jgi:tol-pal system protein YbgF
VFQGRETGQPVVVQPAETQAQINSLGDRLNDLDHTLTRLNGEMDVVRHDLDQSRQEANDLRAQNASLKEEITALDQRLQGAAPPPAPPAEAAPPAAAPAEDATGAFAAARALYLAGDTAGAETAFHDFVDRYGDGPKAPEARYYLAKTLLARKAWPEAATADIGAIRGWPQTRWAPDAVLDLSRALVGLGKAPDACQTLDELAKRYPLAPKGVKVGAQDVRAQAKCE